MCVCCEASPLMEAFFYDGAGEGRGILPPSASSPSLVAGRLKSFKEAIWFFCLQLDEDSPRSSSVFKHSLAFALACLFLQHD